MRDSPKDAWKERECNGSGTKHPRGVAHGEVEVVFCFIKLYKVCFKTKFVCHTTSPLPPLLLPTNIATFIATPPHQHHHLLNSPHWGCAA